MTSRLKIEGIAKQWQTRAVPCRGCNTTAEVVLCVSIGHECQVVDYTTILKCFLSI